MTGFLKQFAATLLSIVLLLACTVGLLSCKMNEKTDIEDGSWLHVDVYGEILEYDPPGGLMGQFTGGGALTLQQILENLDKAATDDRIAGVILQMSGSHSAGMAKLEEIRNAVARVQAAGKKVHGYADSMDAPTYYLAAACDDLSVPPSGYISFTGFGRTSQHVHGLLEKLGINPEVHAIRHYKAAAQLISREDLTPEARKNLAWILDERWDFFCSALQEDRGIGEDQVLAAMEKAFFEPVEAVEAGLFDRLEYWDELEARLRTEGQDELPVVSHSRYADEDPEDLGFKGKKKIAVVHAQGNIGGRQNGTNPLLGLMMGHETIVGELRRALEDKDVVAIVLRIDSGGGESLASDIMGHMVDHVAQTKPVIISMVDVAASGGYVMSYRATKIMANPTTITGSIGSISAKFDMSGFNEKVGLSHDHVGKGPNSDIMQSHRPFTPDEEAKFGDNHWKGFRRWMDDVALERGIATTEIDSLCMGRVWTGRQALANGLVDALGDLNDAVELAKAEAGLEADEKVTLYHLPEQQGLLSELLGNDDEMAAEAVNWAVYRQLRRQAATVQQYLGGPEMMVIDPVFRP
jgi:protease-4